MKQIKTVSLSRKLFFSFLVSIMVPMILVNCIVSFLTGFKQYTDITNQAKNSLQLISAYTTQYINDVDNILKAPYYHSFFQSASSLETLSPYEQNQLSSEIGKQLQLTTYSRDDFGDLIVMSDEKVLYFNSADWYQYLPTVNPLTSREWYTKAMEQQGRIAIVPGEHTTSDDAALRTDDFFISRKLNNLYNLNQTNIITVNLKTHAFQNLFSRLTNSEPVMILFTNKDGELIYSDSPVTPELVRSLGEDQLSFQNKNWKNLSQPLEKYPLTVHVLLSTTSIQIQIATFLLMTLLCFIAGSCIAYLLFRLNNRWIKYPAYHIKSTLKELESGTLTARCAPLDVREFNEIGTSINAMAFQLDEKIKNEYQLSIAHKDLQFQALQSQIQPHFMINTIYSFITLNQIGEQERLNDAFYSFARLLRYVLKKEQHTTLGKELDFLDDYCALHVLRFGDRLSYQIHCEDSLRNYEIPKLVLQPLVENAVIHGIEPSETPCTLSIEVISHQDFMYFVTEDDGVGFAPEQLHSPDSIGIRNVEDRLAIWNANARLFIYRVEHRTIQVVVIPPKPNSQYGE